MPLYEYRCTACGNSFEKIQKYSDAPEKECPKCGGELVRPVTAPALRFEGAGWYVNDYAGKGGSKTAETAATADAASGDAKAKPAEGGAAKPAESKPAPVASAPATSTPSASSSTGSSTGSSTASGS